MTLGSVLGPSHAPLLLLKSGIVATPPSCQSSVTEYGSAHEASVLVVFKSAVGVSDVQRVLSSGWNATRWEQAASLKYPQLGSQGGTHSRGEVSRPSPKHG